MSKESDLIWVDKAEKGDLKAFERLIEKYKDQGFRLAFKILSNGEDAEESLHDAFMKALKNLKKFKRDSSFSTWFYRILYNTCITRLKQRKIRSVSYTDVGESEFVVNSNTTLKDLTGKDRETFLRKARTYLNEEENSLIELYYYHEKDMKEIGVILDQSHGNIRIKLMRTRKKLLRTLQSILHHEVNSLR